MTTLVSVIIPTFNEEDTIGDCLESILHQTYKDIELIVVDDGSSDKTLKIVSKTKAKVFTQKHQGPGVARNLGAKNAKGKILVFVDSDMTFDHNFIRDLVKPITNQHEVGTFSKNEFVKNDKDPWSICWNINKNLPPHRMIPENYPQEAPVFRAILKSEFDKVNGFETNGEYTDDWSLSEKLSKKSVLAAGAIYFHVNPASITEIYKQARWIGKNKFIIGNTSRKVRSLLIYNPISSIIVGMFKSIMYKNPRFFVFKQIYNFAVFTSVLKSFASEGKYK